MQQIQVIGRVGSDAVIRDSNGRRFTTFSVAVDDNYKDQDGQKIERTQWFDCTTDQTNIAQYLTKGTQVFIQGRLRLDTYVDRDNKVRAQAKVSGYKIELLSKPQETARPAETKPLPAGPTFNNNDDAENDLPF